MVNRKTRRRTRRRRRWCLTIDIAWSTKGTLGFYRVSCSKRGVRWRISWSCPKKEQQNPSDPPPSFCTRSAKSGSHFPNLFRFTLRTLTAPHARAYVRPYVRVRAGRARVRARLRECVLTCAWYSGKLKTSVQNYPSTTHAARHRRSHVPQRPILFPNHLVNGVSRRLAKLSA